MNTQKIKTFMIGLLGERIAGFLHGVRFAYLLKFCDRKLDTEMRILSRFLSGGDIAVDVGANGADWTLYLAQSVGNKGRVFAFEADPYYACATQAAVNILGLTQVCFFPFGISDKDENVALRVREDSGLMASGLGHVDRNAPNDDMGVRFVSLRTLDSLVPDHPELLKTAFLKCDVEGYELFVLKGAEKIISEARPVILVETGAFEQQGYSAGDLSRYLDKTGYKPFAMVEGDKLVQTGESMECETAITINRIFIPDERKNDLGLG